MCQVDRSSININSCLFIFCTCFLCYFGFCRIINICLVSSHFLDDVSLSAFVYYES